MSGATRSFADKVRVWLAPPEWRPRDLGGPVVVPVPDRAAHPRYDARAPRSVQVYVAVQFLCAAAATMAYLWVESTAPFVFLAAAAAVLVVTVVSWGALLEGRRWAWPLEIARLAAAAGLIVWMV